MSIEEATESIKNEIKRFPSFIDDWEVGYVDGLRAALFILNPKKSI
jgi:hypothetical protein